MKPLKFLEVVTIVSLAAVFIYAGVLKAIDIEGFATSVANYKVLAHRWNFVVAATLPAIEIVSGLALLFVGTRRASALLILGMNVVFIILLASAAYRGLDIDCGCFSTEGNTTPVEAIARDIVFVVGALFIYIRTPGSSDSGG